MKVTAAKNIYATSPKNYFFAKNFEVCSERIKRLVCQDVRANPEQLCLLSSAQVWRGSLGQYQAPLQHRDTHLLDAQGNTKMPIESTVDICR
jgi:hypothetical protein